MQRIGEMDFPGASQTGDPQMKKWFSAAFVTAMVAAGMAVMPPNVVQASEQANPPQPSAITGPLPPDFTETSAESPRALACHFNQVGDNVHRSGSDASGHGWWVNVDCPSGTKATVTVTLQQYYSDGSWRNMATGSKPGVYSGGGSANRAVARSTCTSSSTTSWRSVIDVDLAGIIDSPNKTVTGAVNITCRVG